MRWLPDKPLGEPGGFWASLHRFDNLYGKSLSRRLWSPSAWKRFVGELSDLPTAVELRLKELNTEGRTQTVGSPGGSATVAVERVSDDGRWVRMVCSYGGRRDGVLGAIGRITEQDAVDFARSMAECFPVTFGCVTDDGGGGWATMLEDRLSRNPEVGIQQSREILGGYPWITICARELVARLGGIEALRATGAFHEVSNSPMARSG